MYSAYTYHSVIVCVCVSVCVSVYVCVYVCVLGFVIRIATYSRKIDT